MKTTKSIIVILFFCLHPLLAAKPNDIAGKWKTPKGLSIVEIEEVNGQYRAKILEILPLAYVDGEVPRDLQNSDPVLRTRSLEGLIIMTGFSYDKKKERWDIQQIYEPERGKNFEGHITLKGPNELSVRGHVPGKKWLGSTEVWTRANKSR